MEKKRDKSTEAENLEVDVIFVFRQRMERWIGRGDGTVEINAIILIIISFDNGLVSAKCLSFEARISYLPFLPLPPDGIDG